MQGRLPSPRIGADAKRPGVGGGGQHTRGQGERSAGPLAERLGLAPPPSGAIEALDEYVGEGYGIPTPGSEEATELFARLEGIPLDPTYGAKAAAGLVDLVRRGVLGPRDTVCFWHTGGATWRAGS